MSVTDTKCTHHWTTTSECPACLRRLLGEARAENAALKAMIDATFSHVDGRDLLAELNPKHWHYCNIHVRINGTSKVYEGDWLKNLMQARDAALAAGERP